MSTTREGFDRAEEKGMCEVRRKAKKFPGKTVAFWKRSGGEENPESTGSWKEARLVTIEHRGGSWKEDEPVEENCLAYHRDLPPD